MNGRPPLRGFNHNVRHGANVLHVQTEDSGPKKPHITTHVFLRGSIVATRRAEYAPELPVEQVQQLLEGQHKTVLLLLKDGLFDEQIDRVANASGTTAQPPPEAPSLIQKFQLHRLDEPGAVVATTEPYTPAMPQVIELVAEPEVEVEIEAEPASDDEVSWEAGGARKSSSASSRRGQQRRSPSQQTPARTRPPVGQGVIIVHPQAVHDEPSPSATPPPEAATSETSGRREFNREPTRVRLPGSGIFRSPHRSARDSGVYQPHPTAEGVVVQRPLGLVDRTNPGIERAVRGAAVPKAGTDPRLPPMATDERSLDEVILAYLAEDLHSKKLP